MKFDIEQIVYNLTKNIEKVISAVLLLVWIVLSLILVSKYTVKGDKGEHILNIKISGGKETAQPAEWKQVWQDFIEQQKNPGKSSLYSSFRQIERKNIFQKYQPGLPDDNKEPKTNETVAATPIPTLYLRYEKVIITPFPIKYMGMFKIGDKITAQINWGGNTKFVSEKDKIESYTVIAINSDIVEIEDVNGKKVGLSYRQETISEALKAEISVTYVLDEKREKKTSTVSAGETVGSNNYLLEIAKITQEALSLKVKYNFKEEDKVTEKEEEITINKSETKVIYLAAQKQNGLKEDSPESSVPPEGTQDAAGPGDKTENIDQSLEVK